MPAEPDARSDRALLAAHVAGGIGAFDELVRRHTDRLWALAYRTLADREDASDVVQEALLSAFRSAAGYRGESEVSTWLYRIVVNACYDQLRRRRLRATETITGHDIPAPRDRIEDHLVRMTVAEALDALPDTQRLAVVLVDVQGFSVAETAAVLGTREGTVKSRCARGRAQLARLLGHLRPPDAARAGPGSAAGRGNGTVVADVEGGAGGRPADGDTSTGAIGGGS